MDEYNLSLSVLADGKLETDFQKLSSEYVIEYTLLNLELKGVR